MPSLCIVERLLPKTSSGQSLQVMIESSLPLFTAANLGRHLADRWLWRGVSFDLRAGDCTGLVAPSGAGKTLLMRNLVLLDPIQQGEVKLVGKSPADWGLPAYRSRVMYIPQRAVALDGTVQDDLKRVFELDIYSQRQFDPALIYTWLGKLGRGSEFLTLQGARLSGGEAQILALLRALQLSPQVLLLDEPTASLDAATTDQVESLLHDWLQQGDRACLLTSHDTEQIRRVTHRQISLEDFV
jgi:putative ABC transport system ATP-binding protein